jgi:hypothetical protein
MEIWLLNRRAEALRDCGGLLERTAEAVRYKRFVNKLRL